MKALTLQDWEEKYIAGNEKRFDQKNQMFNRPGWDQEISGSLKDWSFIGSVRETSGYTLEDQALRWASRRGTMMTLFNASKHNPNPTTQPVMRVLKQDGFGVRVS